jgi:hypothetical protein
LITVGVYGEFHYHGVQSQYENDLRKANGRLVAEIEARAATANLSAECEAPARIKLEQDFAWRRFGPTQRDGLKERLPKFDGKIIVQFHMGDTEGENFAVELINTLRNAGWKRIDIPYVVQTIRSCDKPGCTMSPPPTGILVSGDKASQHAVRALWKALNELGFDADMSRDYEPEGILTVMIDPRPLGPQGEAKVKRRNDVEEIGVRCRSLGDELLAQTGGL